MLHSLNIFEAHVIKQHQPAHSSVATYQPGKTKFDIQEREGQGLCVLLDEVWRPAIWHHEAAAGLDKEKYGVHLYDLEPGRRNDSQRTGDITTFLAGQKSWGFESKEHRPDILFQLHPNVDQYPNRHEPVPWLEIEIDGVLKVVLDIISLSPLRDFTNIPFQLATHVEGGRLEAMCREDCRIATEDFLQRMIPVLGEDGEPQRDEQGVILSERPLKNALQHIKTQFRNSCRCFSWNSLRHDSEFDRRLLSDLPTEDKDANTTKNLPDLGPAELTAVRSRAKGRKSKLAQENEDSCGDNTENDKDTSDQHITNEAVIQSAGKFQSGEGTTERAESCNVESSKLPLDLVSERIIQTATVAKCRRRGRISTKEIFTEKTETVDPEPPSQSLTESALLQDDSITIDPALTTPAVPALPARSQDPLTKPDTSCQSSNVNPHVSSSTTTAADTSIVDQTTNETQPAAHLATARGMGSNDRHGDKPAPSRKHARAPDSDTVEVVDQPQDEPESSVPAPKRQKIVPPAKDCGQVLNNFSAGQRENSPTIHGGDQKSGSFSDGATRSLQRCSESPQLHSTQEATRPLPNTAPLIRPSSYSSIPPATISQQDQAKIIQAEQSRFASVSIKVSSLEILKARLTKAWWKNQVDTSTGGGLYGHRLNISLSQLGPDTSARTDAETRILLTTYNIPVSWSASSINLRQNQHLRQAVHEAMCQAERWDEHNYRKDFPGCLDLGREGGFFLAPAQQSSIKPGDSRFIPFASEKHLNASLHSAMWRYKQLTGRDFAPPHGPPAFSAIGCSYQDAWCEIRRQIFLPYFLRFKDPVEALSWMPELGMLSAWEGAPEMWERSRSHVTDEFGCRYDQEGTRALDPTQFVGQGSGWKKGQREKFSLPLASVDLEDHAGVV